MMKYAGKTSILLQQKYFRQFQHLTSECNYCLPLFDFLFHLKYLTYMISSYCYGFFVWMNIEIHDGSVVRFNFTHTICFKRIPASIQFVDMLKQKNKMMDERLTQ